VDRGPPTAGARGRVLPPLPSALACTSRHPAAPRSEPRRCQRPARGFPQARRVSTPSFPRRLLMVTKEQDIEFTIVRRIPVLGLHLEGGRPDLSDIAIPAE